VLSFGAQDYDAAGGVVVQGLVGVGQRADHRDVEVVGWRAAEFHRGHVASGDLDGDIACQAALWRGRIR
jgi:hypothetical protein